MDLSHNNVILLDRVPSIVTLQAVSSVVTFRNIGSGNYVPWEFRLNCEIISLGVWPFATLSHEFAFVIIAIRCVLVGKVEFRCLVIQVCCNGGITSNLSMV